MIDKTCDRARASLDAASVALSCRSPRLGPVPLDEGDEIVEVRFDPPGIVRRTPFKRTAWDRTFAAAGSAYLLARTEGSLAFDARVLEPATGRTLAAVHSFGDSAVVQHEGGPVELFGDTARAESHVFCVEGDALLALSRCPPAARTRGKFRFD